MRSHRVMQLRLLLKMYVSDEVSGFNFNSHPKPGIK